MVFQGKEYSEFCTAYGSIVKNGHTDLDMACYTCSLDYQWIVKNGAFTGVDGTSLKDYAKVKTVDDNTVYVPGVGYKTNWDILKDILNDRVTTDSEEEAWNSRYNFDKDNKDDKEKRRKTTKKINFLLQFLLFSRTKNRILQKKTLKKILSLTFREKTRLKIND